MKWTASCICIIFLFLSFDGSAQVDSILSRIDYEMDFRFRVEQDWDSRKSDGTFREDRTRLRYRLRTGVTYQDEWYSIGFRIRTGDQRKQQDPQLTIGKGLEEFGTLPLGFEKIYFQGKKNNFKFSLGKNEFPFEKNNELFWSDNVFPEGISVAQKINIKSNLIDNISLRGGHFILYSNDRSLLRDTYFQGIQTGIFFNKDIVKLFPSLYVFRNVADIPDGNDSFKIDYTILHIGGQLKPLKNKNFSLQFDLYQNLENYNTNDNILDELKEEKSGYTFSLQYGNLKSKGKWKFKITYASLQRFAIVDYMAQNDWARWDYSSFNSPDGRLSNFNGVELVSGYALSDKANLVVKYYQVAQLISYGQSKETGQRIRLDLNVKL